MASTDEPVPLQYWDSCLFIAFVSGQEPERAKTIRELLKRARAGVINIAVSELVVAEVRPAKPGTDSNERQILEELLGADHPFMRFYAVTHQIARLSRQIGAQQPALTVPDTIHVATAIVAKADVLYTFDGDTAPKSRRSGDLLRWDRTFGDPPLAIRSPVVDFGPLFEPSTQRDLLAADNAAASPNA